MTQQKYALLKILKYKKYKKYANATVQRLHRVAPLRKIKISILKSPIHNHFQETKR